MTADQSAGDNDGAPVKLAFYMTGNSAKIMRRCMDYLDLKTIAICPNLQGYLETQKETRFSQIDYLYEDFNASFSITDVSQFCEEYASLNLSEALLVDKTHFKKRSNDYQLRYLCTMGVKIAEIFKRSRPQYIIFPIIETADAMLAYRLAQYFGIKPIIYCIARFTGRSFFSDSHLELLPKYTEQIEKSEGDAAWAEQFIKNYRANPSPFNTASDISVMSVYEDIDQDVGVFQRLLRNIWLKFGAEKHNQLISIWINFQVRYQKFFHPIRRSIFFLIERFYIKPKLAPEKSYDFFPLHFSPESSINVPAPYYIDQLRIVDRILLDRSGNRPLVLKEHPAMYGARPIKFFRDLKRRPFVTFVPRQTLSLALIKNAKTVYSVTGTACLEAFLLGVNWVQFGDNFLNDWVRRRQQRNLPANPVDFVRDVLSISRDFVLWSPNISLARDKVLFSRANVERICDQLKFHMQQTENHR